MGLGIIVTNLNFRGIHISRENEQVTETAVAAGAGMTMNRINTSNTLRRKQTNKQQQQQQQQQQRKKLPWILNFIIKIP